MLLSIGSCWIWSRFGEFCQGFSCDLVLDIIGGPSRFLVWVMVRFSWIMWRRIRLHFSLSSALKFDNLTYDHLFYVHCFFVCVRWSWVGSVWSLFVLLWPPKWKGLALPPDWSHTHTRTICLFRCSATLLPILAPFRRRQDFLPLFVTIFPPWGWRGIGTVREH